jgi:decaprenylphospho-beta-D-erythro-pentofuranosid-2-ulose 2-reductase
VRDALGEVQSVLVLGGGSDIGRALCRRLVAGRCHTVVLAGRPEDGMEDVATDLRAAGAARVEIRHWDATDIDTHPKVIGEVFEEFGDIDLVYVPAGILGSQEAFEADPAFAAAAVQINFGGLVSACLVATDRLRQQGHGTIVLMSSVAGLRARKTNFVYGSTKAGLDAFGQGLGDRLAGSGVDVMVVRPGFVRTKMTDGMSEAPFSTTPEQVAELITEGMAKGSEVVWAPPLLRYVFAVFRVLPRSIWRVLSERA